MAIFTAVTRDALAAFLADYGLIPDAFGGIAEGSVNSNYWVEARSADATRPARRLFLRLYEEQGQAGAAAEAQLLRALAAAGVPTPAPVPSASGAAVGTLSDKPAALFPWREGRMRCTRSVSLEDVRQLGASLARVHRSGSGDGLSRSAGRFRRADLEARLDSIARGGVEHSSLAPLAPVLRERLARVDGARARDLPTGLVHGDLFRDNVLFGEDGSLVALLDFESACEGAFAFDLAVCVLAWTYRDDFDLDLGRAMVEGYESERTLAPEERLAFFEEARFAALRFTITRITDFAMRTGEGPRVMKDYRRFVARFDRWTELGAAALHNALFDAPPPARAP